MKNLISALETQKKMLDEMKGLLIQETGDLTDVNLSAMAQVQIRKEDLAFRMQSHAAVLRDAIQEAAAREGLSSRAALGELAAALGKRGNREIARHHAELNAVADQVKEQLTLNREIAERFVASVGSSLDFLSRIINQTSTYGASGIYQQRPAGAVLINREA